LKDDAAMAHCPPELLDDLTALFAEIREWPGVIEKSRGVFDLARQPFLHFHRRADGRRHADVKSRQGWVPFDLPYPISVTRQRAFRLELRRHYAEALSTPAARRQSRRTAAPTRGSGRDGSRRPES
jgi:hypothetical protein